MLVDIHCDQPIQSRHLIIVGEYSTQKHLHVPFILFAICNKEIYIYYLWTCASTTRIISSSYSLLFSKLISKEVQAFPCRLFFFDNSLVGE